MRLRLILLFLFATGASSLVAADYADLKAEPHLYWERKPQDPFSKLVEQLEAGSKRLETGDDMTVLTSLLKALEVPVSSQMLVYSATSLQAGRITPSNPRALYFNENTYVGYVPGGRIEILSLDPDLGAIFYIFDVPRSTGVPVAERSNRCMNCHSGDRMQFVPGLAVESVISSNTGATLDGFRRGQFGHGVPLSERFGGWYLTGADGFKKHYGNIVGTLSPRGLQKDYHAPGELFDWKRYPLATSDILPQLLHEHQAGFVNRVILGTYRTRYLEHQSKGQLTAEQQKQINQDAAMIVRYALFADETPLPSGGIKGDEAFKNDFRQTRVALSNGASLKDFDLKTRMFRYRCSYMIYTPLWDGMPAPLKKQVYAYLGAALSEARPVAEFGYLPLQEKRAIRAILRETKPDLGASWGS